MKISRVLASLLLLLSLVEAKEKKGTPSIKRPSSSRSQLGTSFKFDGTTLRGKYQSALGTQATVEDDKYLEDLLGGRKSFTDRIQKEEQRN